MSTGILGNCSDQSDAENRRRRYCPTNGDKGQSVHSETLRHLIKKSCRAEIKGEGYYFCPAPDCDTVYFHRENGQTFEKKDLIVRVGLKETEDPVWVCYCFDVSKKMIREEMEAEGYSVSVDRIRQGISAKSCACDTKNPSGHCCLGAVLAFEGEVQKNQV
jgi:hypothetical protein